MPKSKLVIGIKVNLLLNNLKNDRNKCRMNALQWLYNKDVYSIIKILFSRNSITIQNKIIYIINSTLLLFVLFNSVVQPHSTCKLFFLHRHIKLSSAYSLSNFPSIYLITSINFTLAILTSYKSWWFNYIISKSFSNYR